MDLSYFPYTLKLKQRFTISTHSRLTTPGVIVELKQDGLTGYGESSLPPYLSEDQSSVIKFLNKLNLAKFKDPLQINSIMEYVNNSAPANYAAKAAVDIALHDLAGKILGIPIFKYLGINKRDDIYTSFTIGISDKEEIKQRIDELSQFKFLKIKLGTENDKEIVNSVRQLTNSPLFIDVNQGWTDKYFALDMLNWLAEQNVILVEQPLPKHNLKESRWLRQRSPLPLIADETAQTFDDLEIISDAYSGVNIKLMKAGGIREAYRMIIKAKDLNLKVMIGCMTETSCAVTAASHLSPLADWVDLDGALLISNDLFRGMSVIDGKIVIPEVPGLGIEKILN